MTRPTIPPLTQLADAVIVGVYTFVMTFLSLLIGRGFAEHLGTLRDAALAGIAAALGALGWELAALTPAKRPQRPVEPRTGAGPSPS